MKRALFSGSFDPFTKGHESIVLRALEVFDEIVIAIGENTTKNGMLSLDNKKSLIQAVFTNYPNVRIESYEGLTYEYAKLLDATALLRGVRNSIDLEYERPIAEVNRILGGIDTVFLFANPDQIHITSTIVRDLVRHRGCVSSMMPEGINLYSYLN